jgi:uncharacterized protein
LVPQSASKQLSYYLTKEVAMTRARFIKARFIPPYSVHAIMLAACMFVAGGPALAQEPPPPPPPMPPARIIVTGEGNVTVAPDYAEITSGVTTQAKTAKDATDANSKAMAALNAALQNAGIAPADIQTMRFSVAPVYGPPQQNNPPKLVGYSVSNQLGIKVRQIGKVGSILDALIAAGATDAGSVQFMHSDTSKALDQARQAAVADARRKAELYAQTAGLTLGSVAWITESPAYAPPGPMGGMRLFAAAATPVPIAAGEDTLSAQITVGFDVAH